MGRVGKTTEKDGRAVRRVQKGRREMKRLPWSRTEGIRGGDSFQLRSNGDWGSRFPQHHHQIIPHCPDLSRTMAPYSRGEYKLI